MAALIERCCPTLVSVLFSLSYNTIPQLKQPEKKDDLAYLLQCIEKINYEPNNRIIMPTMGRRNHRYEYFLRFFFVVVGIEEVFDVENFR